MEKLENSQKIQKEVFIDSLGNIKNDMNNDVDKIDIDKINELISNFKANEKFEKFEAGKYRHRRLLISEFPGVNINIYVTKISDLRNKTDWMY